MHGERVDKQGCMSFGCQSFHLSLTLVDCRHRGATAEAIAGHLFATLFLCAVGFLVSAAVATVVSTRSLRKRLMLERVPDVSPIW